ncbi:hypothetical protein FB45DRAFT_877429 [Roridomyces roridus]|uniref:Uncharacterized protein n=1 Tax=Roridomyces roridus TaxID=1738132 RepID=A0AAD7F7Z7_9AGAR|nr:hypothetical protein FB45DRAFT_877429 [Roridomyces roridus]
MQFSSDAPQTQNAILLFEQDVSSRYPATLNNELRLDHPSAPMDAYHARPEHPLQVYMYLWRGYSPTYLADYGYMIYKTASSAKLLAALRSERIVNDNSFQRDKSSVSWSRVLQSCAEKLSNNRSHDATVSRTQIKFALPAGCKEKHVKRCHLGSLEPCGPAMNRITNKMQLLDSRIFSRLNNVIRSSNAFRALHVETEIHGKYGKTARSPRSNICSGIGICGVQGKLIRPAVIGSVSCSPPPSSRIAGCPLALRRPDPNTLPQTGKTSHALSRCVQSVGGRISFRKELNDCSSDGVDKLLIGIGDVVYCASLGLRPRLRRDLISALLVLLPPTLFLSSASYLNSESLCLQWVQMTLHGGCRSGLAGQTRNADGLPLQDPLSLLRSTPSGNHPCTTRRPVVYPTKLLRITTAVFSYSLGTPPWGVERLLVADEQLGSAQARAPTDSDGCLVPIDSKIAPLCPQVGADGLERLGCMSRSVRWCRMVEGIGYKVTGDGRL